MTTKCIYCNCDENLTVSDIIPDALTLAKFKNKNVCKEHNNLTNTEFENAFANYFSFFRNKIGYTDRRHNKEIMFKADIYANDALVIKNQNFTTLKTFFEKKIIFDGCGNYHLINVKPEFRAIQNPTISYKVNIDWNKLFLSIIAQKTIAKIAYEFHCFNNKINCKKQRYNKIINFILNQEAVNNNPVEVIDDIIFDLFNK